ncbi:MAG: glycosyltransferase family 4 protein [Gemmatimonadetes bacterium]|nr:glycosyltransferase family 4 protein [Gemmatimonadota bacterium]
MRIGVDGVCWASGRGYGRFTRELVRMMIALAPGDEWVIFLDGEAARTFDLDGVRRVGVGIEAAVHAASAQTYRSPADLLRMTAAVRRERPDVLFLPSVYTFFPLPPGQRAVVTIHDAIPERFPALTMPTRRARWFWNAKVWLAVRQADLILTVSDYAAGEIESALGVSRARIRVATEAPAAAYAPTHDCEAIAAAVAPWGLGPADRWFVYVGGFNPHKRVDRIVRAHAEVARGRDRPPHLLLVGQPADDRFYKAVDEIRAAITASGTDALVHWLGWVDDETLRYIHAGSLALVLMSESEGFGLPAVEAAACGAPVIATTESPLPRLLAGGGLFVEPGDHDALVRALRTMTDDERQRSAMAARAREAAARMTWEPGARAALDALREAAA